MTDKRPKRNKNLDHLKLQNKMALVSQIVIVALFVLVVVAAMAGAFN